MTITFENISDCAIYSTEGDENESVGTDLLEQCQP